MKQESPEERQKRIRDEKKKLDAKVQWMLKEKQVRALKEKMASKKKDINKKV